MTTRLESPPAQSAPLVSIVVETVTVLHDSPGDSLVDGLDGALTALSRQHCRRESTETIVVLDCSVDAAEAEVLQQRFPDVRIVRVSSTNYFAQKNAGVAAARGDVVALLDGDCVPDANWLECLTAALVPGVDAVAGCTTYSGGSLSARVFSVPDFSTALRDERGKATGVNLNNVAYRRAVLQAHPFDARIRRNGGCYFHFHQLRACGARVVYEPRAIVVHGLVDGALGFMQKHFERGYDGWSVYQLDQGDTLRGSRYVRRFGGLALAPLVARRIPLDWVRLAKYRSQLGISIAGMPLFGTVMLLARVCELAGGLTAIIDPHRYTRPSERPSTISEQAQ